MTTPTLPTIHLNGTGADSLYREYRAVRKAITAAADALAAATCNQRDFYPQEHGAWEQAKADRAEAFRLLQQVSDYAEHWEMHALNNLWPPTWLPSLSAHTRQPDHHGPPGAHPGN